MQRIPFRAIPYIIPFWKFLEAFRQNENSAQIPPEWIYQFWLVPQPKYIPRNLGILPDSTGNQWRTIKNSSEQTFSSGGTTGTAKCNRLFPAAFDRV